ncbi:MAG TPA: hypothetical protein PKY31_16880 [Spirochaetota bacterium]|nr:hypothetical protein [Spirochaetota bacterium]
MSLKKPYHAYCFILALLIAGGAGSNLRSENVFLKDGRIINGAIVGDAATSITVKKADGKREVISRGDIMRILYTELNMGKIYVQKRDGKSVTAYMVDEDRTTYTFRKELYSPEEFTLNRADVLFIAERNPSGLKGEAETDRVKLEWFPSYDPMKRYNIYIKKKGESYALADTSRKNSHILTGLSSNTDYAARVTGVDREDAETTPSNEFKFLTKNVPPSRPGSVEKKPEATGALRITWGGSVDSDGKVTGYRLYSELKGKRTKVGETGKTEYVVQDAPRYKTVEVVAVDDRGDESSPAGIRLVPLGIAFLVSPGAFVPLGNFSDLGGPGFGGTIAVEKRGLFLPALEAGVEAGFYFLPGVDVMDDEMQKTERIFFVPVSLYCGYRIPLTEALHAVPYLFAGGAYFDMPYVQYDDAALTETDEQVRTFGPTGGAGAALSWRPGESYEIGLKASFGLLLRTSGAFDYPFLRLELCAGVRM